MGLAKIGDMTVRIVRAKPEEAGSGGDGEAKQASRTRSQQGQAEKLTVGIFYTTGQAQLKWPELSRTQCCCLLHRAAGRRSLSATSELGDFSRRSLYVVYRDFDCREG